MLFWHACHFSISLFTLHVSPSAHVCTLSDACTFHLWALFFAEEIVRKLAGVLSGQIVRPRV